MKAIAKTDRGLVRTTNQDMVYCSEKQIGMLPSLFAVADGMGGQAAGDYASSSVMAELVRLVSSKHDRGTVTEILTDAIENANLKLYMESCESPDLDGTGTTLVLAVIEGNTAFIANVGDSRAYVIGKGIRQITRDHSYVEEMVMLGKMKRNSSDYLQSRNIITRAVGTGKKVDVDFFEVEIEEGDRILLCSDGLTDLLDDESIYRIAANSENEETAVDGLIKAANENGGRDNISVILIYDIREK